MTFTQEKTVKQKHNRINKKRFFALFFSIFFVVVFALMQVLDLTIGATASDQVLLTTTVAETISIGCGADVVFGTLTPGTPVTGSSVCTVTTNANGGYNLQAKRDDADTTMDKTSDPAVNITDKTAWDPATSGNAVTWVPASTGLGFTVFASTATKNSTWWGAGTAEGDALNEYAGFPVAYANIMVHAAYSAAATTTSVGYKLDVPSTQKSGAYDGTVTYQAVSTP